MNQIIIRQEKKIKVLCEKHYVKSLFVFGSALTQRFNEKSDIDFLVSFANVPLLDFADNYLSFCDSLQEILNCEVQVVVESSIRNPVFKKEIDHTKQLLFAA